MEQLLIVIGFLLLSALSNWINKKAQPQTDNPESDKKPAEVSQPKPPELNLEDLLKQILSGSKSSPAKQEPPAKQAPAVKVVPKISEQKPPASISNRIPKSVIEVKTTIEPQRAQITQSMMDSDTQKTIELKTLTPITDLRVNLQPINKQAILARQMLKQRNSLQQAFIVSEIIGAPKGL